MMLRTMKYLSSPLVIGAMLTPSVVLAKDCKAEDVYAEPPPAKKCKPKPDQTELEKCVAKCREEFAPVRGAFEEYTDEAARIAKEVTTTVIKNVKYLRCAPEEVQYGAIFGGGLVGSLFGIRRGLFKKLIYGGIGAAGTASVIFPCQAKVVAKQGFELAKTYTIIAYNFAIGAQPNDCPPKKAENSPLEKVE